MTKETFARGLQLINSILAKNSQLNSPDTMSGYYLLLEDIEDEDYINGVRALMKRWKNPHFIPGPGEIRDAAEKEKFGGLTLDEMVLIQQAYKKTNILFSDNKINQILQQNPTILVEHLNKNKAYTVDILD